LSGRRNDGDVADAAQVLEGAPLRPRREQHRVGDRDERRALTARGHVAHSEVTHHVDAGSFRDDGRFTRLPRRVTHLVPDGVPVRCDRHDVVARDPRFGHHFNGGVSEPTAHVEVEAAVLCRCGARKSSGEALALLGAVRPRRECEKIGIQPARVGVSSRLEPRDRRADSVERSSGHESDDDAGRHL
jgi:hypothetical protein